jgi:molybdate transport system regulatory protein
MRLRLAQALGHEPADRRIDVLRRIAEAGSISEAARLAGISYKAAWQAIETLGNLAGQPMVEKAVGGSGGGGARLTAAGHRVLEAADRLAGARRAALAMLGDDDGWSAGLAGLALRTSMRNALPCVVTGLTPAGGGAVRVSLALSDGTALAARLTAESAELLGLQPGLPVIALCKATGVRVAARVTAAPGRNRLAGRIARAATAPDDAEVGLRLPCGLQLVGFTRRPGTLAQDRAACAAIEESAVVIALGG